MLFVHFVGVNPNGGVESEFVNELRHRIIFRINMLTESLRLGGINSIRNLSNLNHCGVSVEGAPINITYPHVRFPGQCGPRVHLQAFVGDPYHFSPVFIFNPSRRMREKVSVMYHNERGRIMTHRERFKYSFSQIIGEHAVHICDMTTAEQAGEKKRLMASWEEINAVNKRWVNSVTQNERPESEFSAATHKLVHLYTDALADYILNKVATPEWRAKIGALVDTERKFFDALGNSSISGRKHWVAYTGSIIHMCNTLARYGEKSQAYDDAAGDCIRCGVRLGDWLDHTLSK